jgi:UDP:flavonoid glycosyltransferase YjiC (YdhE family)
LVSLRQPFLALALALIAHGHRVRIGTHAVFADWVRSTGNGQIEHFDIGGDPKELMA